MKKFADYIDLVVEGQYKRKFFNIRLKRPE